MHHLATIPAFTTILTSIAESTEQWKSYLANLRATTAVDIEGFKELDNFHLLLLSKILRPDLFVEKLKEFINVEIGEYFTQTQIYSLEEVYEESNAGLPIIFILSPGNDPLQEIKSLVRGGDIKDMRQLSLGKDQGPIARKMIDECLNYGLCMLL